MRRDSSRLQRAFESRSVAPAAALVLVCLLVIALLARYSGSVNELVVDLDRDATALSSIPARFAPTNAELQPDPHARHQPHQLQVKDKSQARPESAPKLQPKVLSAFVSGPAGPLPPGSPEQANFVDGYKRVKPIIAAASYAPQTYTATQGIVMPAGKSWRLGSAYVALQYLRHTLGCTLPVQIWHTAGEIDEVSRLYFEACNCDPCTVLSCHTCPLV